MKSTKNNIDKNFREISDKLILLYNNDENKIDINFYDKKIKELIGKFNKENPLINNFDLSENTVVLISYADNIYLNNKKQTLKTLKKFHNSFLKDVFNCVHILPFFPSSGDGGFSVKDHNKVEESFGTWKDIKSFAKDINIMADIVINHASSQGLWFKNYLKEKKPGKDFFFSIDDDFKTSNVIRTRDHKLIQKFKVANKNKKLWCTFSNDQIDLNFKNPEVLLVFIELIINFINKGISILRLDAVGFLWKETNTECLNLPQTHLIIKLLRSVVDCLNIESVLVTETNLPRKENLSYFGNNDEAHWIYNFSLAPLLVYTVLFENSSDLSNWSKSMPPARTGNSYLNFIASHDGIGMRPIEGILTNNKTKNLFERIKNNGGKFSHRKFMQIDKKVYEANISLFNALKFSDFDKSGKFSFERFVACHCIMFAMEGVPAIYFNSIFGTEDDNIAYKNTKHKRDLNRYKWEINKIEQLLNQNSKENKIYNAFKQLLKIRKQQKAFHPNATQYTLSLGPNIFGIWRQSTDKTQSIFNLTNVTSKSIKFNLSNINLIEDENWSDLIGNKNNINTNEVIEFEPFQTLWLTNKI